MKTTGRIGKPARLTSLALLVFASMGFWGSPAAGYSEASRCRRFLRMATSTN